MNQLTQFETAEALVREPLQLSQEQIFWLRVEMAHSFLIEFIGEENESVLLMEQTPEFWIWWRQIWAINDRQFFDTYGKETLEAMANARKQLPMYAAWHKMKINGKRPNDAILISYHKIIKEATKEKAKAL